jgi:hypothetical protein
LGPARQRLVGDDRARLYVDDRLVRRADIASLEDPLQKPPRRG